MFGRAVAATASVQRRTREPIPYFPALSICTSSSRKDAASNSTTTRSTECAPRTSLARNVSALQQWDFDVHAVAAKQHLHFSAIQILDMISVYFFLSDKYWGKSAACIRHTSSLNTKPFTPLQNPSILTLFTELHHHHHHRSVLCISKHTILH